ncbi:flavin reductase family protein [Nocardia sp. NRRL S-836]|uniref:flavin reductase family protein n=1 Tax=Nocardia sp. NRRL S-836 TaxID=1519492 RepID=UPI0006AFF76C|nr:flavin reductase family protein [Nocardia sp. NRRL S-836]
METIDATRFRQTLGHLPTGVVVITATDPLGRPVGMACNSFTSVSLDPPLVLFCVKRGSSTWPVVQAAGAFRVNVLDRDHEHLSRQFAARGVDRFAGVRWTSAPAGPRLADVVASIGCEVEAEHPGGDHVIVVARALSLEIGETAAEPLVFHRGRYGSFAAFDPAR